MTDQKPDLGPYFTLLGRFTHWWAYAEHGMDVMMAIIYHKYDAQKVVNRKLPLGGFDQKLTYLRNAIVKLPAIAAYATLPSLLDRMDKLSEDRHLFTHGAPLDYDTQITTMYKMNFQKGTFLIERTERRVTLTELETMADEATALADALVATAHEMVLKFA